MHWEKEIRIRITVRRIATIVLAASTVANMIIVGAVFGADSPTGVPTASPEWTSSLPAPTFLIPHSGGGGTSTPVAPISASTTPESTQPPTATPTELPALTQELVDSPGWNVCIKKFYWPTYRVRSGDTLFALATASGTTVNQLKSANCLSDDRIISGQVLYVPRALINTATATPTSTATPSAIATISQTPTPTQTTVTVLPSATDTPTPTSTFTQIPSATYTPTYTPMPSATPTRTETATQIPSPTWTYTPTTVLNSPPDIEIISPLNGSSHSYTVSNPWSTTIRLQGRASDAEDDVLPDSSLTWTTNIKPPAGNPNQWNGPTPMVTLYSNACTGTWHTITLTGRDSQGAVSTAMISIFIGEGAFCEAANPLPVPNQ